MIDETYSKFFIRDFDNIDFVIKTNIDKVDDSIDLYNVLNTYMRLNQVELQNIIRKEKIKYSPLNFKFFLHDLLTELFAAIEFHHSIKNESSLSEEQIIFVNILNNFNTKFLIGLKNNYYQFFPSEFAQFSAYKKTESGFEINTDIEKTETFKFSRLIARGLVEYDKQNFYFENQMYESDAGLGKKLGINRVYLSDTKNDSIGEHNKNIFSQGRLGTQKYIIEKMRSSGEPLCDFYMDILHKKGL